MSAADYGLEGGAGQGSASTTTSYAAPPMPASVLTTPSDPASPASAPAPLREDQVSNAVSFLVHPKVRS